MAIRPGGLNRTSQAAPNHHQETLGAKGSRPVAAAMVLSAARAVVQRSPTSVSNGTVSRLCVIPAAGGVAVKSRRFGRTPS